MLTRRSYVTLAGCDRDEPSTGDDLDAPPYALRGIARLSNDRVKIA